MEGRIRERDASIAEIERSLVSARSGRGNSLFIIGEAGLGKTTLLEHAVTMAADFEVFRGRGEPMESTIAFGLADQAFPGFTPEPGDTEPVDASVPFIRVYRWIESIASKSRPLLVLLDDLHWADRDSLDLFLFLARRLSHLPVSLIGALRPWPPEVSAAIREIGPERARAEWLEPLNRESVLELLRERNDQLSEETLDLGWQMSAGNPLLVEQVGRSLAADRELPGVLNLDRASTEILLGRFAGLDDTTLSLAGAASVAGIQFRTELIDEVSGLTGTERDDGYEALFRSGLLESSNPGWLRFTHPLIRQAIYDDLSPHSRERFHADLFASLAERGFEREAAEHAIAAGLEGSPEAAEILERVGNAARSAGAVASAARDFEAAVRFRGDRAAPELLLVTVTSLLAAGRPADAVPYAERLLSIPDLEPRLRFEALRALAKTSYFSGSGDLGDRQMNEAVDLAAELDPALAVRPLLDQTSIAWMAQGPAAALPIAERAVELGRRTSPELHESALAVWGHLAIETGDPAGFESLAPLDRRFETGDTAGLLDPAELVWAPAPIYGYSHTLKYAERFDECLSAMVQARQVLEAAGAANGIATVSLFIGNHLVRQGRPDAALVEADRAEEFSDLTPFAWPLTPLMRAEALVWKGEFDEAGRQLAKARELTPEPRTWLSRLWSGHVEGLLKLWSADPVASDIFLEVERLAAEVGMAEISSQPWEDHAVEAHLAAGRLDDAERVTALIEERSQRIGTKWPGAVALLARGRIEEFEGSERAGDTYRQAIEVMGETDMPLHRAELLIASGSWLRRNGSPVESRAPLAEAAALAYEWGGGYLSRVATDELALAGGRRRRATSPNELTPAEVRVAREAAIGRTNEEIARHLHLSPNTVRSHLKRVFTKLEINSRRKLAGKLGDDQS